MLWWDHSESLSSLYGLRGVFRHRPLSNNNGYGIIVALLWIFLLNIPWRQNHRAQIVICRNWICKGLDLANFILIEPCLSGTSSSFLFPKGGLGWALPFPFLQILLPFKTKELVTKLIKCQQNSSKTLTLVSTTRVSTTIPPLSSTLRTKNWWCELCWNRTSDYQENSMTVTLHMSKPDTRSA